MKNKLNKIIDIVKKVVSVAVTIVLSAVVLGFSISILGVGIVITIAGIVICIPIAVIFNSQTIISEIIEIHKQKKELLISRICHVKLLNCGWMTVNKTSKSNTMEKGIKVMVM